MIRLGTRGSVLALTQARIVADAIGGAEIVPIKTSGDATKAGSAKTQVPGDKTRFVKEIEQALLAEEVDVGVHSAKDLPDEFPGGLEVAGVTKRETPLDAYVGKGGSVKEIPEGAKIGTSSLRRQSQLLSLRPDLEVVGLRGNVDTRLRRLEEGELDGIVIAAAGLRRLGRQDEIAFLFQPWQLTPAAGQGAIALETRADDERARDAAVRATDRTAVAELLAERAVLAPLEASCHTPVGALAETKGPRLTLTGFVGLPDGSETVRDSVEEIEAVGEAAGRNLAERMIEAGAADILERATKAG